jgi:hypothetical protein
MYKVRILLLISLCLALIGCEEEKRAVRPEQACGILEGIVMINPSPYSISEVYGSSLEGSPYVRIQLIGESKTVDYLVGSDFGPIGRGIYRASFSMGAYDCNKGAPPILQGVKPGEYSIVFSDGYFDAAQGRIPLKQLMLSTVNNAPIDVKSDRTTNVGIVILTPP